MNDHSSIPQARRGGDTAPASPAPAAIDQGPAGPALTPTVLAEALASVLDDQAAARALRDAPGLWCGAVEAIPGALVARIVLPDTVSAAALVAAENRVASALGLPADTVIIDPARLTPRCAYVYVIVDDQEDHLDAGVSTVRAALVAAAVVAGVTSGLLLPPWVPLLVGGAFLAAVLVRARRSGPPRDTDRDRGAAALHVAAGGAVAILGALPVAVLAAATHTVVPALVGACGVAVAAAVARAAAILRRSGGAR